MRAEMNRPGANRLRVLHVVPSFYPALGYGGPVRALYELCLAQVQAGLDVRVLTSDANGAIRMAALSDRWVTEYGVPTFYAPVRLGQDIAPSLLWQIGKALCTADLLHVSGLWSPTSVLAQALARLANRPVVLSPHGALMPWAMQSGRGQNQKERALQLLRPLLDRIHGWHVSSQAEAAGIRALGDRGLLRPDVPIACVEYGIWPDDIAQNDKPPRSGPPQIVVLGRIHPVKRLELAVSALAALHKTHPDAELTFAGPTENAAYRLRIEALADSLGVARSIRWPGLLGPQEKTDRLFSAHALWLCSHMESFGMVVIEALAQGTPVVATKQTPWAALSTEQIGRQVDPDPQAFADETRALLSLPPSSQQALSSRCRAFVRAHYTWPAQEARLRVFYEACAGEIQRP